MTACHSLTIAHSLKLGMVAEGVETEEQARLLAQEGCSTIQGYLASRPIHADEMTALLQTTGWRSGRGDDGEELVRPRVA